ncbi:response regulator [uncultured Pontibacter sp.]|uniref:response regulator n=1 Tax=uncultured Pontibacter sp. TaxID=453356 RepID=UPI002607BBA9|nr:response regulator [uncultured Pontibacter sp.]
MKKFKKILFIDDDPIATYFNKCLIGKLNLSQEIESTATEQEGLAWIQTNCRGPYKGKKHQGQVLIFSDLTITAMNGFQLINAIRELEQKKEIQAPFLYFLTSSELTEMFTACDTSFVHGFLSKNLSEDDIHLVLSEDKQIVMQL